MKFRIIQRARPNSMDTTIYESTDGRWRLHKEHFAQGPSLFDWRIENTKMPGVGFTMKPFRTKKAAVLWIERWLAHTQERECS